VARRTNTTNAAHMWQWPEREVIGVSSPRYGSLLS